MPTGTPRLERIKEAVSARFPDAIYGQYNCRRRNGWNWSQHAGSEPPRGYRGNAVDIVHQRYGYGDTSHAHQRWLDEVNAYLVANREVLDLNELIWRKRNHFDHIHTSPWPKMHDAGLYKPPCKGGDLITVNEDGTRGTTFNVDAPPPPPPTLENDMFCKLGDTDSMNVRYQQRRMNRVGGGLTIDGDYGAATRTSVINIAGGDGNQIHDFESDAIEAFILKETSPDSVSVPHNHVIAASETSVN